MRKLAYSFFAVGGLLILVNLFSFSSEKLSDDETFRKSFINNYSIFALPKPNTELAFCGEIVPIDEINIWERFDKELLKNTYWQSNTLLLIKRANKYFSIIEPILSQYNVPQDFKYLALIESGLENVVSPAGATGFWQIMKTTAKEYGLEVNDEVDERYHLKKSTMVACEYLLAAKEKFGTWTLAAAAYNMGQNGLQRQMKSQNALSYYDLLLNDETSRYVFRILALKEIVENQKKYGFNLRETDLYMQTPTYTISIDSSIANWTDFAHEYKINYKLLKIHNPWLRKNYLKNTSRKIYEVEIPQINNH